MNLKVITRLFWKFLAATCLILFLFNPALTYAADIEAVTDSADGSSAFTVKSSTNVEQAHVDSIGNIVTKGCVRIDSGLVECSEAEGLVIDGNVGIGTVNPTGKLQVVGQISRFGLAGTVNFLSGDGDVYVRNDLEIDNNLYGNRIFAAGNLGVGTTSPQALLQVAGGDVLVGTGVFTNTSVAPDLYVTGNMEVDGTIYGDGSGITVLSTTLPAGGWTDGGTNVYSTVTTDNVGIGTTTPNAATLEVVKNAAQAPLKISASATGSGDFLIVTSTGSVGIGTTTPVRGTAIMNGNVGIGTWNPIAGMDIKGSAARVWAGTGINTNATSAGELYVEGDLEVDGTIYGDGTGITALATTLPAGGWTDGGVNVYMTTTTDNVGIGTTTPTAALLIENAGTQDSLRVNDGVLDTTPFVIDAGGNIGVGTTGPILPLDLRRDGVAVSGNFVANALLRNAALTTGINLGYNSADLSGAVSTSGGGALTFWTSNGTWAERLRLTSTGNVGIGTSTPVGGLVVMSGNVGVGTWNPIAGLDVKSSAARIWTGIGINTNASSAGELYVEGDLEVDGTIYGDGTGITALATTLPAGGWTDGGTNVYSTTTTDNVGIGTTTPTAALSIENAGTQDSFRINDSVLDATPLIVDAGGNVGIGTTTSADKVEIVSAVNNLGLSITNTSVGGPQLHLISTDAGGRNYGLYSTASGNTIGAGRLAIRDFTSNIDRVVLDSSGNIGIGTATPINGTSIMNGNVGIGTWNPVGSLDVRGGSATRIWTAVGIDTNATNAGELYVEGDLEVDGTIYGDGTGITQLLSTLPAGGWTDGGTNIFTTATTDNVGIGTTTPNAATLEVVKNAAQAPLRISSSATGAGDFLNISSAGQIGIGTSVITSGTGLAVMNGNVGIGTWSPASAMHIRMATNYIRVSGTPNAGAGFLNIRPDSGNAGYVTFSENGVADRGAIGFDAGSGGMNFYTGGILNNGAVRMTIQSGGNVGIGTTTPINGTSIMNGNVGIGTWNPIGSLDVRGGSATRIWTATGIDTNATSAGELYVEGDLEVDGTIYGDGSGITALPTTLAAGGWIDGGTNVYQTATTDSVGLGTTTPSASTTLEIIKQSSNAPLKISSSPTSTGDFLNVSSAGLIGIGTTLNSVSTGLAIMNGNVGIGTWNPAALLAFPTGTTASNGINFGDATANLYRSGAGIIKTDGSLITTGNITVTGGFVAGGTSLNLLSNGANQNVTITPNGTGSTILNGNVGVGTTTPVNGTSIMNGNVGIGTWNPQGSLDVRGGTATRIWTAAGIDTNATNAGELYVEGDLEVDGTIYGDGTGITQLSSTLPAGGWTDGGTNIFTTATTDSVGIGTTTPTASTTLEIVKQSTSSPLKISSSAIGAGDFLNVTSAGLVGIGTTLNSASTALAVMSGNVGVGTWSPAARLDVNGIVFVRGANANAPPTPASALELFAGRDISGALNANQTAADLAFNYGGPGGGYRHFIRTRHNSAANDPGNAMEFYINASGTSGASSAPGTGNRLTLGLYGNGTVGIGTTIPVVGTSIMNGNVGIGTWNPQGSLDVRGGTATRIWTAAGIDTNATNAGELYVEGDLEVDGTIYGDGTGITQLSSTLPAGGWTDGGTNIFTTATTDSVGIGTTTPTASTTLEIVKQSTSAPLKISSSAVGAGDFLNVTSAGLVGIGTTLNSTSTALSIMSGNVGIGTWSPGLSLEISKSTIQRLIKFSDTNPADGGNANMEMGLGGVGNQYEFGIWNSSGTEILNLSRDGGISFGSYGVAEAPANGMIVAGNVGIGTLNPLALLTTGSGNVGIGTIYPVNGTSIMNGNVGIGTWSPNSKLEVKGGVASVISTGGTNTNATSAGEMYVQGDFEVDGTIYGDGSGITALATTLPAGGWTDGGTNMYQTTTTDSVGIGTTTPNAATLEIVKQAATAPLKISSSATGAGDFLIMSSSGNIGIGTTATTTAAMTIMNGNVGLGTTNPPVLFAVGRGIPLSATASNDAFFAHDVEVRGNVYANSIIGGQVLTGNIDMQGHFLLSSVNDLPLDGNNDATPDIDITSTGLVGIGTSTPLSKLAVNGNAAIGAGYRNVAAPSNGLLVEGNVGIGTITPVGGLTVMNGNVGIGTWSPEAILNIKKAQNAATNVLIDNPTSGTGAYAAYSSKNNSGSIADFGITSAAYTANGALAGSSGYIYSDAANGITVMAANASGVVKIAAGGNAEKMRIDATGNVGIGTTTPVNGTSIMNGNVGIGTWNPIGSLDVRGGAATRIWTAAGIDTNATSAGELYVEGDLEVDGTIYGDGSGITALPTTLAAGGWIDGGTNVYQTATTDSVGIGTTTPTASTTLEIVKQSTSAPLKISSSATGAGDFLNITSGGRIGIGTTLNASGAGLSVMNGNVGIGTWNPASKLHISGGGLTANSLLTSQAAFYGWSSVGGSNNDNAEVYLGSNANFRGVLKYTGSTDGSLFLENTYNNALANIYFRTKTSGTAVTALTIQADGNLGIGTTVPIGALTVMNGNVGIGTWSPNSGLELKGSNASIISTGGTNTNAAGAGELYVQGDLEVDGTIYGDGSGITALPTTLAAGGWIDGGTNVYQTATTDSVGIGTTTPTASTTLEIVKQSTSAPLKISSSATGVGDFFNITSGGRVGIGTTLNASGAGLSVMNGNVGIGTWSPARPLEVNGGIKATLLEIPVASHQSRFVQANVNDLDFYNQDGGLYLRSANGYIKFSTNAIDRAIIDSSGSVGIGTLTPVGGTAIMNGNVGIGTWSPNSGLEVKGSNASVISTGGTNTNAASAGELYVQGDLEVDGTIYGDGTGITALPTTLAAGGWIDGGTNVYQTATTDSVGIGTTTPTASTTLEIVKQSTSAPLKISSSATGAGDFLNITSGGRVGIGTTLNASGAGLSVMNGNVGIGTWVPASALDVKGALTVGSTSVTYSSSAGGLLLNGILYGSQLAFGAAYNTGGYLYQNGTDIYLKNNAGGGIYFLPNGVGNTYLSSTGNLGIGTITPVGGLTVMNGNVGIGTWSPNSGLELKGSNASIISTGGTNTNAAGAGELYVQGDLEVDGTIYGDGTGITALPTTLAAGGWIDGGTNVYQTATTDSVGIGTTTPTASTTLEIVKQSTNAPLKVSSSATGAGDFLNVTSGGSVGIGTTLNASGAGLSVMNGNVGIGTWNPLSKLHISGAVASASVQNIEWASASVSLGTDWGGLELFNNNATTNNYGSIYFSSRDSAGAKVTGGVIQSVFTDHTAGSVSNDIAFRNRNAGAVGEKVRIMASGNVGISTANPASLLSVGSTSQFQINSTGSIAAVTGITTSGGYTQTGVGINSLSGNTGLGTTTPVGGLTVMNGNVGIGTWSPNSGVEIKGNNVSIISTGGTNTNAAGAGELYVQGDLEVDGTIYGDGSGITALPSGLAAGGWTDDGAVVRLTTGADSVGIGTTTPVAGLAVMNGNVGIGTWSPSSRFEINGAMGTVTISKSGNYTATINDSVIIVDASAGAVTITLPAASGVKGRVYHIKKTDASVNLLTIDGNGAETIDGALTVNTTSQYFSYTLVCDGSNWWLI